MKRPLLTRSLTLEAPLQVSDGAGGYTHEWQTLGFLWAQLKAGSGRERASFAATVSRVPYRIIVRASPYGSPSRPVAGQRFRDGERIWKIDAVGEHDAYGQFLTCYTQEETAS
ncbi:head-tail adaptor protein [Yoonia sediminilitoris]|uniref:Head-tail adaptor n=1 Tax=Yoonia sediminilitoris TaxID=1286148 RepID=A0A2T6KDN7_9RHOB|nr:head-tail adaptor protein [Yoonia sediminilitoris]PUB13130.1 head-tail adaptor [Yoonia sediminilitoris]RCW94465.1 head-tail adaptor [Yoonia sediminilitoris]